MPPPIVPGQGPPRPSPQNPLMGPGPGGAFTSPAAMAAWAKQFNIALPPPPKPPAMQGGVPAGQFLGAPGSVKTPTAGPYPGYMTPAEMMEQAKQMADMSFAPVLQAAGDQQRMLHAQNQAQLQAIQKVYELMGIDPKSALGVANYNKAVSEAQQSESEFAGKLVDLIAQRGQAQAGYLSDLQKQQAGLYGDYQGSHTPKYHFGANGEIVSYDASGNIKVVRPGNAPGGGKLTAKMVNGQVVWFDPTTGKPVSTYGEPKAASAPRLTFRDVGGHTWGIDPTTGEKKIDLGPSGSARAQARLTFKNINGHTWGVDPFTGAKKIDLGPSGTPKGAKATKTVILDPITHTPLTSSTIKGYEQDTIATIRAARASGKTLKDVLDHMPVNIPKAIALPVIMKSYGIPAWAAAGVGSTAQTAQLRNMGVARLHNIALFLGVPLDGTHTYPGGHGYTRQELIQQIRAHLPKAEAAAMAAGGGYGSRLVDLAKTQLGQPYVWGAESRKEGGFDCSGLVDWAMRQDGYTGPRVTTYSLAKMGTSVKGQPLLPGDLIITHSGGHVVMYVGDGKVIAAPHSGSVVQIQDASQFKQDDVRRLSGGQVPGYAGGRGRTMASRGPDAPRIDAFLHRQGSPMTGLGNVFVAAGKKYRIDPALLVAIAGAESSFGTYGPTARFHNPFGWGPGIRFSNWQSAIYAVAKGLRRGYYDKGLNTPELIQPKWAPNRASNDPNNLNSNWLRNVIGYYKALTGSPGGVV